MFCRELCFLALCGCLQVQKCYKEEIKTGALSSQIDPKLECAVFSKGAQIEIGAASNGARKKPNWGLTPGLEGYVGNMCKSS